PSIDPSHRPMPSALLPFPLSTAAQAHPSGTLTSHSTGRYDRFMIRQHRRPAWDRSSVRALRQHLGLTQQALSDELGIRQQTVSEWECGRYAPRGASARLLTLLAERAGFAYAADADPGDQHE
ncbi:MAG: helix-turn-helix transcriptional regulator, partial [Chloroflexi bacterium]|nr:helix-turn-helix transcriptional regulator [Chloroflexota bacterium]